MLSLSGCGGSDGTNGAPGPGTASLDAATALNIEITQVTIKSAPVVKFKVTNQDGVAVAGLTLTDLRFTIAKLMPGANGAPSAWQNYINTTSSGISSTTGTYIRGNRENNGTLVDNKDGTYVYTFHTDITDPAQTCPAAPCIDADGNTLDTSYNPNLTTRVVIQTRGARPMVNGIYTFRPSDGATTGLTSREIVSTSKCNVCHNKLEAHDARIETDYCVTCHNPGSTAKGQIGTVVGPTPVDFKVLIHKIHNGNALPSVTAGGDYGIFGFSGSLESFKDVVFPQDIRNCTKCHDAATTAQGDNWETQPSKAACSSCHDDVYFGTVSDPAKPYQVTSHIDVAAAKGVTVGPDPGDDTCIQCHGAGQVAPIADVHAIPSKVLAMKYKFNLLSVTGGATPSIEFSVTDPTNLDPVTSAEVPYDIGAGDATTNPAFKTPSNARLALDIGWNTTDFTNTGSGANPAQPISVDPVAACTPPGTGVADWVCTNVNNIFTLTKQSALSASATGTGRVGFEGHPAGADSTGAYTIRIPVKSKVMDWSIDGSAVKARRTVVDVAKCDNCHDQLSLHGNNRTDEPQLCVICHNPNDTDANVRPKNGSGVLDNTLTSDGLYERPIDFKIMIHAIHGAGMRANPFVVYGFGGSVHNFGDLRFPGILNDCSTCHSGTSYQLTGTWEAPTQKGILATTIRTTPTATDATSYATQLATPDDDLNISPTAAVCSACHDGATAQAHMESLGGAKFSDTQTTINTGFETCSVCHGPGAIADVQVVHSVP